MPAACLDRRGGYPELQPSDDLLKELGQRYLSRRDAKALQHKGGAYMPVRDGDATVPWKMGDLRAHVAGTASYGHYLVNADKKCKLFAFDIDLDKYVHEGEGDDGKPVYRLNSDGSKFSPRAVWAGAETPAKRQYARQLRVLAEGLAYRCQRHLDIPAAVAYSGSKGVHVYAFTGDAIAADAIEAATLILRSFTFDLVRGNVFWKHSSQFEHLTIELFPKQAEIGADGFGNLMRLPLGVNLKGGAAYFLDSRADDGVFKPLDPMVALTKGTLFR